jgi:hypothetical protein
MANQDARFTQSCADAAEYPKNLVCHKSYDYLLTAYAEQLDEQESRLFCDDSKASVYIRQHNEVRKGVPDDLTCQKAL